MMKRKYGTIAVGAVGAIGVFLVLLSASCAIGNHYYPLDTNSTAGTSNNGPVPSMTEFPGTGNQTGIGQGNTIVQAQEIVPNVACSIVPQFSNPVVITTGFKNELISASPVTFLVSSTQPITVIPGSFTADNNNFVEQSIQQPSTTTISIVGYFPQASSGTSIHLSVALAQNAAATAVCNSPSIVVQTQLPAKVAVYREISTATLDFLHTLTNNEASPAYQSQGLAFYLFQNPEPSSNCAVPVSRCWNPANWNHFVSTDGGCDGSTQEMILGYACASSEPNTFGLFRAVNIITYNNDAHLSADYSLLMSQIPADFGAGGNWVDPTGQGNDNGWRWDIFQNAYVFSQ